LKLDTTARIVFNYAAINDVAVVPGFNGISLFGKTTAGYRAMFDEMIM